MKRILLVVFLIISALLWGKTEEVKVRADTVKLAFENVKIKKLEFTDDAYITVDYPAKSDLKIDKKKDLVSFSSSEEVRIKLMLPGTNNYLYEEDDTRVYFGVEYVRILTDDSEIVEFFEDKLVVRDKEDGAVVTIGPDGILVEDKDERVEIGSSGIIVEGEDEDVNLTGFWGQMLGGFIRFVTKTSMAYVGKNSEQIVKHIINDEEDEGYVVQIGDFSSGEGERVTREIERTIQPRKNATLVIKNLNGPVILEGWDKDYINLHVTKTTRVDEEELDKVKIDISGQKDIRIESRLEERRARVSVKYELQVPMDINVESISTSNGRIVVVDANGDLELVTSNGRIEVMRFDGDLNATTSNGRIALEQVGGQVYARTSNGSIRIAETPGIRRAVTSNGKIELDLRKYDHEIDLTTSNGSIYLNLADDINADIHASTSNGRIKLEGIKVLTSTVSQNQLRGQIGDGGPLIRAATSNSNIYIESLTD